MIIRRIDDHEVQCLLGRDDLEKFGVSLDEIMMGNEKARRLIEKVIALAESEYGFKAGSMPLSVEIRPVPPDKLALFISSSRQEEVSGKQELISGLENIFKTLSRTVQELKNAVDARQGEEMLESVGEGAKPAPILLKFPDYEAMRSFVERRNIFQSEENTEGSVYYMDNSFYIWMVPGIEDEIWKRTVADYGEEILEGQQKKEVLEEHGKKIGSVQSLLESVESEEVKKFEVNC